MKKWRDASAVIIAARNNFPSLVPKSKKDVSADYLVLTGQRAAKSSFLPDGYVFPGGVLENENDCSSQWKDLFQSLKFSTMRLNSPKINETFPGKLAIYQTPKDENLPRNLSLRIAAIRETFEECGVLLCRDKSLDRSTKYGNNLVLQHEKLLEFGQNKDPNKFFELCARLNCFPDIWSLTEARNWLTPAFFPKRFDTAFFICCLDQIPPVVIDRTEISDFKWDTPLNYIEEHKSGKLNLPPPQLYEFHVIANYLTLDSLQNAAESSLLCGNQCYLPIRFILKDGAAIALPGDTFYEVRQDEKDIRDFKDLTIAAFREQTDKLHRFEIFTKGKASFVKS